MGRRLEHWILTSITSAAATCSSTPACSSTTTDAVVAASSAVVCPSTTSAILAAATTIAAGSARRQSSCRSQLRRPSTSTACCIELLTKFWRVPERAAVAVAAGRHQPARSVPGLACPKPAIEPEYCRSALTWRHVWHEPYDRCTRPDGRHAWTAAKSSADGHDSAADDDDAAEDVADEPTVRWYASATKRDVNAADAGTDEWHDAHDADDDAEPYDSVVARHDAERWRQPNDAGWFPVATCWNGRNGRHGWWRYAAEWHALVGHETGGQPEPPL